MGLRTLFLRGLQAPRVLLEQLLKVAEVGLGPSSPKKELSFLFPLS